MFTNFTDFLKGRGINERVINENSDSGRFAIKRRYTENYPARNINLNTKIRKRVLEFMEDRQVVTKKELRAYFNELKENEDINVSSSWFNANKYLFNIDEDAEGGETYLELSSKGRKIVERIGLSNSVRNSDNISENDDEDIDENDEVDIFDEGDVFEDEDEIKEGDTVTLIDMESIDEDLDFLNGAQGTVAQVAPNKDADVPSGKEKSVFKIVFYETQHDKDGNELKDIEIGNKDNVKKEPEGQNSNQPQQQQTSW